MNKNTIVHTIKNITSNVFTLTLKFVCTYPNTHTYTYTYENKHTRDVTQK